MTQLFIGVFLDCIIWPSVGLSGIINQRPDPWVHDQGETIEVAPNKVGGNRQIEATCVLPAFYSSYSSYSLVSFIYTTLLGCKIY
jgi:hypothetical protein